MVVDITLRNILTVYSDNIFTYLPKTMTVDTYVS